MGRLVLANRPKTRVTANRPLLCTLQLGDLRATHVGNHLQHCTAVLTATAAISATRVRRAGTTLAMAAADRRDRYSHLAAIGTAVFGHPGRELSLCAVAPGYRLLL